MSRLEVTILGCGSSGGVPRADGNWGACDPADPKNRRTRCSMLARRLSDKGGDETTVLIDTSPDFRLQCASADVKRLDAVLYTHDHADQTHGIDDLRVFAGRMRRRIDCYADRYTRDLLERRFRYVFEGELGYPAVAQMHDLPELGRAFTISGPSGEVPVTTFHQVHGDIDSVGYRLGPIAYSSDVNAIADDVLERLQGVELWIVDALRWTPHVSHAHVDLALEWIARVKPARAVLTNLHIDLDYESLRRSLPEGVEPAYDGWRAVLPL